MMNDSIPQSIMGEDNKLENIDISVLEKEESNIDKQLRASNGYVIAEFLLQILLKETVNDTERAIVFSNLPDLDWKALDLYSRDNKQYLDDNACFILVNWLYSVVPDMKEKEKLTTMQATLGLDGVYSESFAGLMVQIFEKDRIGFFQLVSKIDQIKNAEQTVILLANGCSYKSDEEIKQIEIELIEYITSPELSFLDKHWISLFLDRLVKL